MTSATHLSLALAGGLAGGMGLWPLSFFCLGSIFPDKIDFFLSAGSYEKWSKIHRTWTHSWWVILFSGVLAQLGLLCVVKHVRSEFLPIEGMLPYFFLGMLFHVACDSLTPAGIPLLHPNGKRRGLGIIRAKGIGNTALCLGGFIFSGYFLWYKFSLGEQEILISVKALIMRFFQAL